MSHYYPNLVFQHTDEQWYAVADPAEWTEDDVIDHGASLSGNPRFKFGPFSGSDEAIDYLQSACGNAGSYQVESYVANVDDISDEWSKLTHEYEVKLREKWVSEAQSPRSGRRYPF